VPGVTEEMVEVLIEEGFLSYDDITFLEPIELAELVNIDEDSAEDIIAFAEEAAETVEAEEQESRSKPREPAAPVLTPAQKAEKLLSGGPLPPAAPTVSESGRAAFESLFAPAAQAPAETEAPVEEAPVSEPAPEPAPEQAPAEQSAVEVPSEAPAPAPEGPQQ
jgi:N utilization substance protein A